MFETFAVEQRQELEKVFAEGGGFYAWGAEPGHQNLLRWQAMEPSDLILCFYDSTYHFIARVLAKYDNEKFVRRLWGTNERTGNTWRYLYFLKKPTAIDIPVQTSHPISTPITWGSHASAMIVSRR